MGIKHSPYKGEFAIKYNDEFWVQNTNEKCQAHVLDAVCIHGMICILILFHEIYLLFISSLLFSGLQWSVDLVEVLVIIVKLLTSFKGS